MNKVTDIWFRTSLSLINLAEKLGVEEIQPDIENYWQWVIGYLDVYQLDITRCHRVQAIETDTRIFSLSHNTFSQEFINSITKKLKDLDITPIYLGTWQYVSGDDFNKILRHTIN